MCFLLQKEARQKWDKEDPGEDEINDEDKVPGVPMFKEGGENHRPIRGEKIEQDETDKDRKTYFIKAPEVRTPWNFDKDPAEEKSIEGDQ